MPIAAGSHPKSKPELDLPPLFRLVTLREAGDAFAYAQSIAAAQGAGTLVHVGRFDLAEFAVVLEPDEPLRTARRAFLAGAVALADALSVFAPPEKAIELTWPDAIRVDGGLVGGARLGWPAAASEGVPPDWLVFSAMIRTVTTGEQESGGCPPATLEGEGFDDAGSGRLVESFARHLALRIDAWQEFGFAAIADIYLSRLAPDRGARRGIDQNGDLLVHPMQGGEVIRHSLAAALAAPSWLDPDTGEPRT